MERHAHRSQHDRHSKISISLSRFPSSQRNISSSWWRYSRDITASVVASWKAENCRNWRIYEKESVELFEFLFQLFVILIRSWDMLSSAYLILYHSCYFIIYFVRYFIRIHIALAFLWVTSCRYRYFRSSQMARFLRLLSRAYLLHLDIFLPIFWG